ncbi:DedA family protein [Chlorobaculum sp. 24CR]|uniref:DedA family protein n=1 Tax=Chlorobaculum sp. 24CR TaxID=2508878 RepID=UPI00100C3333|nr:DedA family protein [Chlorobaculum sp. 24CR]RXK88019.1 DedA family protein [Chlorobaculum sp. 24CR]
MELFSTLTDFILHIDRHLQLLASEYGLWLYGILFLIIFLETGLVVMPLLPGDSLLFAAGSLAAIPMSQLSPHWLFAVFSVAAILGDSVNYAIGHALGPKVFSFKKSRFFNPEHLRQTHDFFEKYGGKTIIIARFIPIVRTFAPFVAGIGAMSYSRFFMYNVVGALLWVAVFTYGGYLVGQLSFFKENFKLLIVAIIVVSLMIPLIEYVKHHMRR